MATLPTPPPTPPSREAVVYNLAAYHTSLANQAHILGTSYRNLGLQYHEIPWLLRFHWSIQSRTTGLARQSFEISANRELPQMIYLLGTLDQCLSAVAAMLSLQKEDQVDVAMVRENLRVAETLVQEGLQVLENVREVVAIYARLIFIVTLEGWENWEEGYNRDRREKAKDKWEDALPRLCQVVEPARLERLEAIEE